MTSEQQQEGGRRPRLYEGHYISYTRPCVEEGTPEARKRGCLCQHRDEVSAEERMCPDWVLHRIHEDCPLHKVIPVKEVDGEFVPDWPEQSDLGAHKGDGERG